MAKTKTIRVSEEELAALKAYRENAKAGVEEVVATAPAGATDAQQALADAFVNAIERTRKPENLTIANRKRRTPWTPKAGDPQPKLKRKMFQHGIQLTGRISPEEINLLNQVRPGSYCEGFVRVTVRKDRGLDISYPVKTASQRLKLLNQFSIGSFTDLLKRIIDEKANPTKYRRPDDLDIYEDA